MWVLDPDGGRHPGRVHGRRDEEPAVLVLWTVQAQKVQFYRWVHTGRAVPRPG